MSIGCSLVGGGWNDEREGCEIPVLDSSTQEGKGVLRDIF